MEEDAWDRGYGYSRDPRLHGAEVEPEADEQQQADNTYYQYYGEDDHAEDANGEHDEEDGVYAQEEQEEQQWVEGQAVNGWLWNGSEWVPDPAYLAAMEAEAEAAIQERQRLSMQPKEDEDGQVETKYEGEAVPAAVAPAPAAPGATSYQDDDEEIVCRVCRGEAEEGRPLYAPCKCDGSIKFIHQAWLQHCGHDHCELYVHTCVHVHRLIALDRCRHRFQFDPLIDPSAPESLPMAVALEMLFKQFKAKVPLVTKLVLAVLCWTVWLPLAISWFFRLSLLGQELVSSGVLFNTSRLTSEWVSGVILCACVGLAFFALSLIGQFVVDEYALLDQVQRIHVAPAAPLVDNNVPMLPVVEQGGNGVAAVAGGQAQGVAPGVEPQPEAAAQPEAPPQPEAQPAEEQPAAAEPAAQPAPLVQAFAADAADNAAGDDEGAAGDADNDDVLGLDEGGLPEVQELFGLGQAAWWHPIMYTLHAFGGGIVFISVFLLSPKLVFRMYQYLQGAPAMTSKEKAVKYSFEDSTLQASELLDILRGYGLLLSITFVLLCTSVIVKRVTGKALYEWFPRIRATGSVIKVATALCWMLIVTPAIIGQLLERIVFIPYPQALFTAHTKYWAAHPFSWFICVWASGLAFEFLLTSFVFQLRESLHPRILHRWVQPFDPRQNVLLHIFQQAPWTLMRRVLSSCLLFIVCALWLLAVPLLGLRTWIPLPRTLSANDFAFEYAILAFSHIVLYVCAINLLDLKNLGVWLLNAWLRVVSGWHGVKYFLLPVPKHQHVQQQPAAEPAADGADGGVAAAVVPDAQPEEPAAAPEGDAAAVVPAAEDEAEEEPEAEEPADLPLDGDDDDENERPAAQANEADAQALEALSFTSDTIMWLVAATPSIERRLQLLQRAVQVHKQFVVTLYANGRSSMPPTIVDPLITSAELACAISAVNQHRNAATERELPTWQLVPRLCSVSVLAAISSWIAVAAGFTFVMWLGQQVMQSFTSFDKYTSQVMQASAGLYLGTRIISTIEFGGAVLCRVFGAMMMQFNVFDFLEKLPPSTRRLAKGTAPKWIGLALRGWRAEMSAEQVLVQVDRNRRPMRKCLMALYVWFLLFVPMPLCLGWAVGTLLPKYYQLFVPWTIGQLWSCWLRGILISSLLSELCLQGGLGTVAYRFMITLARRILTGKVTKLLQRTVGGNTQMLFAMTCRTQIYPTLRVLLLCAMQGGSCRCWLRHSCQVPDMTELCTVQCALNQQTCAPVMPSWAAPSYCEPRVVFDSNSGYCSMVPFWLMLLQLEVMFNFRVLRAMFRLFRNTQQSMWQERYLLGVRVRNLHQL